MAYIKNIKPINIFQGLSPYKSVYNKTPKLNYFYVLRSTIYVFIHKEKRDLKSEKFASRVLKS